MDLWPHQRKALEAAERWHRKTRSRVLVEAPPGTGKTEIACRSALAFVKARPFGRAVICVSSLAILGQFHRRMAALTTIPIGIEQAERHTRTERIVIASLSSLRGRLEKYDPKNLLVLDEAHHANDDAAATQETADRFSHVLSLTASPWSEGALSFLADSERIKLRYSEALNSGLCAPYQLKSWKIPADPSAWSSVPATKPHASAPPSCASQAGLALTREKCLHGSRAGRPARLRSYAPIACCGKDSTSHAAPPFGSTATPKARSL